MNQWGKGYWWGVSATTLGFIVVIVLGELSK
jgi:hypothetical protein